MRWLEKDDVIKLEKNDAKIEGCAFLDLTQYRT